MLKYTHKSRGKVSKKDKLVFHVVADFPSKALIDYCYDGIKDQSNEKDWNDMWVIGCHVPYVKLLIKLLKIKKKLLPWAVMPFTDWELHSSSTLGPENNRFPLLY